MDYVAERDDTGLPGYWHCEWHQACEIRPPLQCVYELSKSFKEHCEVRGKGGGEEVRFALHKVCFYFVHLVSRVRFLTSIVLLTPVAYTSN
ncbi:hypothetical protein BaRGS_00012757 [Batillaria attramentaria]|uniref:Uncharacterized protein n=1 Tax=Batillaria attramentaria TaxID=370345 RepID=A0ABD0L9T5_9CAEN